MSWTGIQAVSQAQHLGSTAFSAPQMSSQNYLSRVPTLPETVYGTSQLYPQTSGQRQDTSSYYQTQNRSEQLKATSSLGQHYFVDQMMNPHPYSSLYPGFDINSIRRKNASRETTGPLKAWLSQHKKNPYPTKGEKVMLAIATRMTLTQVSTWFANARRRMKKDNLGEYEDDTDGKESEPDRRDRSGSLSSRVSSSEADTSKELSDLSDLDEITTKPVRPAKKCVQRLFSPEVRADNLMDPASSPESLPETVKETPQASTDNRLPPVSEMIRSRLPTLEIAEKLPQQMKQTAETTSNGKPKIWSISEIIGTASKAINADNTSGFAYTSANQNRVPTLSDNMQYSSYGNDLYQSNLMQTYSNYYMNGQPSYQYGFSDQLNSSVTSSNTSLDNSLNTSGGFSAISDNNETILFL